MKTTNKTLHFTLGPVQGFVSQARRTRDLWASSYLLSWLVGKAMIEIGQDKISFPDIHNDPLIKAIFEKKGNPQGRQIGSIPNRFTATNSCGDECSAAIDKAWQQVTEAVRKLADPDWNSKQPRINPDLWDRQVKGLWDCQWVLGENSWLLDQRKNLRNHYPANESGEKCTVCGERQELSGIEKPVPTQINQWWDETIRSNNDIHDLDLKQGERLCAVCLCKRLFPKVAPDAIGWAVPEYYPSTAYLSSIDWLCEILLLAQTNNSIREAINQLLNTAKRTLPRKLEAAERYALIQGIQSQLKESGISEEFAALDGDTFYLASIQEGLLDVNGQTDAEKTSNRNQLSQALKQLYQSIRTIKPRLAEPSPFYAILFMDGDGMGQLLGACSVIDRTKVSAALAKFTQQVPNIVKTEHNGILVYAGGDDVFALLPVSQALSCAMKCRQVYLNAFKPLVAQGIVQKSAATISAAIEYTHMNTALGVVVKDSHTLLDDIAKDYTGRDAIACRVWKRGGPILTWSQPWEAIEQGDLVEQVCCAFQNDNNDLDQFSSKFFYKLRDLFELAQSDSQANVFSEEQLKDLLLVEYLANREHSWEKVDKEKIREKAEERVKKIMQLCQQKTREIVSSTGDSKVVITAGDYHIDGALLIRFLSQKEV